MNLADDLGYTPMVASKLSKDKLVRALLHRTDIQVNMMDTTGSSALWWATSKGNVNVLNLLLKDARVDVNSKDHRGATTLFYAAIFMKWNILMRFWCKIAST